MTAAVTNPFKLTWGSFVVGGTTERLIDGLHSLIKTHDTFEVTLDVVIRGTSDSTFAANCAEMESEFSKRRQSILFQVGSSTIQTFDPASSTHTGLNTYATIDKVGTEGADTDRSRRYTITVGCELPSTDTSGRRDVRITVDRTPAKQMTVTFDGVWTALTSNTATAQYAAQIDAYCSSILTAIDSGATFEQINGLGRTERDDQDHTINFSRSYREIIVAQPSGSLDNANIVEPTFTLTRALTSDGESGTDVKRLTTITASFSCWIDHENTTDIDSLYTGTVRQYMIDQMTSTFAPSQYGIISEQSDYDPYTNRLTATLVFQAAINPQPFIGKQDRAKIQETSGVVLTGAWTGQLFAKYRDQGIARRLRFASRRALYLGEVLAPSPRVGSGNENDLWAQVTGGGGGANWALMEADHEVRAFKIGQRGGSQIDVTELILNTVEEYYEEPQVRRGVVTGDPQQVDTSTPPPPTTGGGGSGPVVTPRGDGATAQPGSNPSTGGGGGGSGWAPRAGVGQPIPGVPFAPP